MNLRNFFAELKRRNVYRVAVAYAVVAWLLIQLASILFPTFEAPGWVMKVFIAVVALGLPIALLFAWAFELTPEGLKRTEDVPAEESITRSTSRKLDFAIIGILAVVVALLLFDRFRPQPQRQGGGDVEKSIAVLPFENLSKDQENAYFATGVQDEILTRLAKVGELKVISRTSTQQYQSRPGNLREIAQQLGVAHILEGSVQKAGDSVRVNVQLIKADTDAHLWAETYDRKLSEIFQVQSDIAQRVAESLEAKLTGREKAAVNYAGTKIPAAYDAYLRGVALLTRVSLDDVQKARGFFQQAVELDSQYAPAWAQLAVAEAQLFFGREHTPEQSNRARVAAETAVRLQPELGEARMGLASFYYYCLQDFDRALAELDEAQKRSPGASNIVFTVGLVKRRQGKLDEAIAAMRKAAVGDPRNSDLWTNLGVTYRGMRDFKSAAEMLERAHAISPDEGGVIAHQAEMYLAQGDLAAAENVLRGQPASSGDALYQSALCFIYRRQFDDAIQAFGKVLEETKNQPDFFYADVRGWMGHLLVVRGDVAKGRPLIEQSRRELLAIRNAGNTSLSICDALIDHNAALGDRKEVEREAADLRQRTQRDHWRAPTTEEVIARAYATMGDADRAIPLIANVLSVPYRRSLTPAVLRLDPAWDKIRNDPRFQKLAEGKQ